MSGAHIYPTRAWDSRPGAQGLPELGVTSDISSSLGQGRQESLSLLLWDTLLGIARLPLGAWTESLSTWLPLYFPSSPKLLGVWLVQGVLQET